MNGVKDTSTGNPKLDVNIRSLILIGIFLYFSLYNLLKKDYAVRMICAVVAVITANASPSVFNFKWYGHCSRCPCLYWV